MKASHQDQIGLLELQRLDTRIDQLAHAASNMPERRDLAESERKAAEISDAIATLEAEAGDLSSAVRRMEGEVETARRRMERDLHLLDSGTIGSGRQLSELQHEIESLTRRIRELEDGELEVMERAESADRTLSTARAELGAISSRCQDLRAHVAARSSASAVDQAALGGDRARLAASLPGPLVDLYEKVRDHQGGVGAAALRGGRCDGCHLQIPSTEEQRIRSAPDDEVVRCEECRRILVREAE